MKKTLLLLFALMTSIGMAWADKTVYFKPDVWDKDNAVFAAYVFGNGSEWIDLTTTVTIGDNTYYQVVIPSKYTGLKFVRDDAGRTYTDGNGNWTVYNQTNDITLSDYSDNTLFTITGWGGKDFSTITLSTNTYTAEFVTNQSWANVYAYAWSGDGNTALKYLGNWPGTAMTTNETVSYLGESRNVYSVTITTPAESAPEKIIFDNGSGEQTLTFSFADATRYAPLPDAPAYASDRVKTITGYYGEMTGSYGADGMDKTTTISGRTVYHATTPTADSRIEGVNLYGDNSLTNNYMKNLHMEVFAVDDVANARVEVYSYGWQHATVNLTGGQWNTIDLPINSFSASLINASSIKLANSTGAALGTEIFITDVFFYNDAVKPELVANMDSRTGTSVTFRLKSFKGKNAATDGITYNITWDNSGSQVVNRENGNEFTQEITGLTTGTEYHFSITATDAANQTSDAVLFTVVPVAPPTEPSTPIIADENIKVIYIGDDSKSAAELNKHRVSDYQLDGWTRKALKYDEGNNVEFTMTTLDVSDMEYMHLDIYPLDATTLALFVNGTGQSWKGYDLNERNEIPAGAWYSVDIPVTFFTETCSHAMNTLTNIVLVSHVSNTTGHDGFVDFSSPYKSFVIGNMYFWKEASTFTLTATPGTNTLLLNGATTNITTTVTDIDSSDKTSSSTITYESSNTSVVSVSSEGIVTATGVGTATVTVSATYNEITKTKDISFTVLLPKPTEPTELQENVAVVFSSQYGYGTALNDCNSGYGKSGIPTDPIFTEVTYFAAQDNHKVVKVVGAAVNGRVLDPNNYYRAVNSKDGETPTAAAMSEFAAAKVSIWPTTATKGYYFGDNEYATKKVEFTLTPNQWNYITVMNPTTTNYVLVYLTQADGTPETNFYLDHFYVAKPAAGEIFIGSPDNKGIAAVTGNITMSNVSLVEACTAKVIDISRTTLDGDVTTISLDNNQLLLVNSSSSIADNDAGNISSTQATQLTGNTTNVIVKNGDFYWGANQINYVDDNAHQPNTAFNINANKGGYQIQRTIGAGKYVTSYLPIGVAVGDIPDGLTIYEFDQISTPSEVKFNKRITGMVASTPYVLHNSTDGDILLTATQPANPGVNTDLNLTVTPNSVNNTNETVSFKGNYAVITGEGETKWGLQNATSGVTLGKIGTNAKIGAFRAYFTGLSTAATARFFDGETTKIGTIDANGEIETGVIYNLAGQRVQNPTKGIYIINGKKVVIK